MRASGEAESLRLTRCDGEVLPEAEARLSMLLRPYSAARPKDIPAAAPAPGTEWAPGVKEIDPGVVARLQSIAREYPGKKLTIVSGYRPTSNGSYHKLARAVDVRVDGVKNESLVVFCRGLVDTGCGYYPNSSFVHVDVRPKGTGHVYWIDASGPGESPKYVASWPPPKNEPAQEIAKPDHAAPADEHQHEAERGKAGHGIGESDRDRSKDGDEGDVS